MQRFKEFIIEMATFSPKNFPYSVGNNSDFPGAGERTTYVPTDVNNYKFKEGFRTAKVGAIYRSDGSVFKQVPENTKVWFTLPATLHRAEEFGIPRRTTLAPVSLKGHDQRPDGYMAISSVIKPAGNNQGRVGAGSQTQDMVAQFVKDMAFKNGIEVETEFKTARPGSTIPDLVMTIEKKKTQFEIKGTNNRTAPITFFDKSIRRQGRQSELIDDISQVYINTLKIGRDPVSRIMTTNDLSKTFIGLIDAFKLSDPKIGLAGDEGVVKSGRLPAAFAITDKTALAKLKKVIVDHFKDGGDDYFVVHNRSGDNFEIYYVGGGSAGNVLKAPELPDFKSFVLATYGGASGGATRVGLKIKL